MEQIKFEEVEGSIDSLETKPNKNIFYFIDFAKMQKVEDLVLVLASLGLGISEDNPYFSQIRPFLNLDNPIDMGKKK